MKKLHIGPGNTYLPDWINIDIFSNVKADMYSSALSLPYERESFDIIYASHVLEHFSKYFTLSALSHWRNLLKVGGILRIAVPNFESVYQYYSKTKDLKILLGLLYGGQDNILNYHYIIFNKETLTEALNKVGFANIYDWDWKTTEHSQFDDYSQAYLPHMDKEYGLHMSLNLEAVK